MVFSVSVHPGGLTVPIPSRDGKADRSRRIHAGTREAWRYSRRCAGHQAQTEADKERAELAPVQHLLSGVNARPDRQIAMGRHPKSAVTSLGERERRGSAYRRLREHMVSVRNTWPADIWVGSKKFPPPMWLQVELHQRSAGFQSSWNVRGDKRESPVVAPRPSQ